MKESNKPPQQLKEQQVKTAKAPNKPQKAGKQSVGKGHGVVASKGLAEHVAAYRGTESKRNVGNGDNVRQATFTNRNAKGTGINKDSSYSKQGGNLDV